jgi:hypothetical protein
MKTTKSNFWRKMIAAMGAAYQEQQDEAAEDPRIKGQTWEDFFSPYCPAADDDGVIDYCARKATRIAQGKRNKKTGGLDR